MLIDTENPEKVAPVSESVLFVKAAEYTTVSWHSSSSYPAMQIGQDPSFNFLQASKHLRSFPQLDREPKNVHDELLLFKERLEEVEVQSYHWHRCCLLSVAQSGSGQKGPGPLQSLRESFGWNHETPKRKMRIIVLQHSQQSNQHHSHNKFENSNAVPLFSERRRQKRLQYCSFWFIMGSIFEWWTFYKSTKKIIQNCNDVNYGLRARPKFGLSMTSLENSKQCLNYQVSSEWI